MPNGRLEAQITVPTGWTVSINDGGGVDVATVTPGNYYPTTTFLAAVEAAIEAAVGTGFTLTAAATEGGTGQATIAKNSGSFSITAWGSNDLRDALGFTGTTGSATSHTGANGMQGVWLPDCAYGGQMFDHQLVGHRISDFRQTIGPSGDVFSLIGNSYNAHRGVRWTLIGRDRAIYGASATIVSWQEFVRESQWGDLSYFAVGAPVRFYTDATAGTLLGTYRLVLSPTLEMNKATDGWTGLWPVEIPQLIED